MPLNPRILAVFASIALLTGGAVGVTYVAGAGPFEDAPDPVLENFTTTGPTCATDNGTGYSFELATADGQSQLTIDGAVEVPDLAHSLENASVERTGDANYTFSVETTEADNGTMGATCIGEIEYTADLTIPEDANASFSVAVVVDDEQTAILRNSPGSAGVEMSSSEPADEQ